LRFIASLSCCACGGRGGVVPHHLLRVGDRPKGMGRKNEDRWTIPMCFRCHAVLHARGDEAAYLDEHGIAGPDLAGQLWRETGDYEAGSFLVFFERSA
tara:strand:+ start:423 stop:716 length:294 start_codon:yes stop_codon:yes gene_type:complete